MTNKLVRKTGQVTIDTLYYRQSNRYVRSVTFFCANILCI